VFLLCVVASAVVAGVLISAARDASAAPGDVTADNVFGQAGSFTTATCNNGGLSASSLCGASGIAVDPFGNVYIADADNNRVLEYDDPLNTDFIADRVLGQGPSGTNFNTKICTYGSPTAFTLCLPLDVATDSLGNVYVADFLNERVVQYDNPIANDVIADRVFGQLGSFTTAIQNKGGIGPDSLASPVSVAVDPAGNLYVGDRSNNRVLGFQTPISSGTTADIVFGQLGSFTSTAYNIGNVISANGLNGIHGVGTDSGGNLYIADQGNHRALKYNTPFSSGTTADLVFGQLGSFSSGVADINGVTADSLESPTDVAVDSAGNVYISETGNERMLEYDEPVSLGTTADLVYGQGPTGTNFSGFGYNLNASGFGGDPYGIAIDPDCNIYLVDMDRRALEYDLPPKACVVAGTPTPTSTVCPVPICTATPTATPTSTSTPTMAIDPCSPGPTCTPTPSGCVPPPCTATPTETPTDTPAATSTDTPFVDPTDTPSPTPSMTSTPTVTGTSTATSTSTPPVLSTVVVHWAIDCNLTLAGTQADCIGVPGDVIDIGILFGHDSTSDVKLGAFAFEVHDPDTSRLSPLPPVGSGKDANPDFSQGTVPGDEWLCFPPPEHASSDDGPGTAVSRIDCFQDHGSRITAAGLPPGSETLVAVVHYRVPLDALEGVAPLTLEDGHARDGELVESGSCAPVRVVAMTCTGAILTIVGPHVNKVPEGNAANADPAVPKANLWLCESGLCAGPGEGSLRVVERASNVVTGDQNADTVEDGLGAYEFTVEYDSFVIASVNPCDIVFGPTGAGSTRGPADELDTSDNADCSPDPNAINNGTCAMSIILENLVHFGCVTNGQTPGPTGDFDLASLNLIPHEDLADDLFPGNNNGVLTVIKDNGCELVDVFGHPVLGSVNGGLTPECGNLAVTVRILEGDLNLDCIVDVTDEQLIAYRYGAFFGSVIYSKWYDLEPELHDLDIDIKDIQKVFGRDGSTCQAPIPDQPPLDSPAPGG
jgi:hypothetical protein